MSAFHLGTRRVLTGIVALMLGAGVWQVTWAAGSGVPTPNPLPPGPTAPASPAPSVDIASAGRASEIHGDLVAGAGKFHNACASCHGERGTVGIANPGSDDGKVPTLNPIDPGFLEDSNFDPAILAHDIDLFVQHGSLPSGKKPLINMFAFGDQKLVPQQDLADIEAYVMSLNGVFWPDRCPGVLLDLGNPSPGSRVELGSYVVEGRAVDIRAQKGAGIDRIDFFLEDRDLGGRFLGTTSVGVSGASDPNRFRTTLALPNLPGAHNLFAYAYSAVRGQEAVVSVPIALGEDPATAGISTASAATLTCAW